MKNKNRKPKFTVRKAREKDIPVLVDFLVEIGLHVSGAGRKTLAKPLPVSPI